MDRTLKALSVLLRYPTSELQAAIPEIRDVFAADSRLGAARCQAFEPLLTELAQRDIYDLEERYILLFDRSRTLSLNLFEHVHGESRDRGSAMVSLLETYRAGGFEPASAELPDHLPLLLEYLSMQPGPEAQETLADAAHILEAIRVRLTRRQSSYAPIFATLVCLSGAQIGTEAVAELTAEPETDPNDLDALDAVWAESEVQFGPDPNAGCPQVRDMLARMTPPDMSPDAPPQATHPSAAE